MTRLGSDVAVQVRKQRKEDPFRRSSDSLRYSRHSPGATVPGFLMPPLHGWGPGGGDDPATLRGRDDPETSALREWLRAVNFLAAEGKFGEGTELFLFGVEAPAAENDAQAGHHGDGKINAEDARDFPSGHDAEDRGERMQFR